MKLHRLTLTNYRGISHRDIEFPDHGVVVVSGANEVGKSSMIEALDLLIQAKDRSAKKDVKQVKPTHADVGAEISAEISTGPYRFVYHKRFHKRTETQLTMLAPRREELSGDEAHERVLTLLRDTVDMDLWHAQRVLQAASTTAVDLSGCDALSQALDVAAGEAVELSGSEPFLIDRIEAEYLTYFTRTGRPTGEWAAATSRLRAADDEVARCAAAVAEVDDAVRQHTTLTEELGRLAEQQTQAVQRHAAATSAAEAVARLNQQRKEAAVVAAAAEATHNAAVAALTERRRLRADIDERAAAVAELDTAAAEAVEDEATATKVRAEAEAVADEARTAVETSQARLDAARRTVQQLSDRDEADRLAGRLAKIEAAQRELDGVDRELTGITLTEESMRDIEAAVLAVERAESQVELAAAQIELVAAADIDVHVDGESIALPAGASWSSSTADPTVIELPGVLTARVAPGAPAADTGAKLAAAQDALADQLRQCNLDDVAAARMIDQRRRELVTIRDRLSATLDGLIGGDSVTELRERLAELHEVTPTSADLFAVADIAAARAERDTVAATHQQAAEDCETHRKVATAAAQRLTEKATRASAVREKLAGARFELDLARERLSAQRDSVGDDQLAVKAEADGEAARQATARVAELDAELAGTAPDTVTAELDEAVREVDSVKHDHEAAAEALREVSVQLTVYGTEGRKGQLDAAETEREHAEAEYHRLHRRARAAELLRSVMARHRDATRMRYVDPFRSQVERLGRIVFGDSFEVEIDSELRIRSRTLAGRTVPYESLSGGAKEQLGIVARLAGAVLVAKEDSVPVVIDDALGFTDADRLTKMGAVFDAVGGDGQVIVLTCSPHRYDGIGSAHHIELTAPHANASVQQAATA